jgi:hypothetical protein
MLRLEVFAIVTRRNTCFGVHARNAVSPVDIFGWHRKLVEEEPNA